MELSLKSLFFFVYIIINSSCGTDETTKITELKDVEIGDQIWMKYDLYVNTFRNGDTIYNAITNKEWEVAGDNKKAAWCFYKIKNNNRLKFGKLYNWYAVNDPCGLAPKGYHIPSYNEWKKLMKNLGGVYVAGKKMKSIEAWYDSNNESGFSALPGGSRNYNGFNYVGVFGNWWTSSESGETHAVYFNLYIGSNILNQGSDYKSSGYSVRCLKN